MGELLFLTSGHLTQECLKSCAGTGRNASAFETNAGAEANGRARVDIRMVRVMRPVFEKERRLCIKRDVKNWDMCGRVLCLVMNE